VHTEAVASRRKQSEEARAIADDYAPKILADFNHRSPLLDLVDVAPTPEKPINFYADPETGKFYDPRAEAILNAPPAPTIDPEPITRVEPSAKARKGKKS